MQQATNQNQLVAAGSFNHTLIQLKCNMKARQMMKESLPSLREAPVLKILSWASLPRKILEQIFQYIDHHHLITYCTLVCKLWRRAIQSDRFITSLTIANDEATLSYVYNFLRRFKSLRSLTLNNVYDIEAILQQAHKVCPGLKCISLVNYQYIAYHVLGYIARSFPKLEGLNFNSSNVDCNNLSTDITLFSHLKSLNLYNVKALGLSTQGILEIVLNCRELEEINIGLCPPMVNLYDEDVMVIISNLAPKLTSLTLDSRRLTMRSLERVKKCQLLRRLFIKYAVNLTGEFLSEFWKNLHSVEELGFTHNCIINGYDVSMMFLNGAHIFKDLLLLDLTYCALVGDIGIQAIATVCTKLNKILLKSCRSITNILPLFKNCIQLRFIDVSYCTQLKMNFILPVQLEVIIIDERKMVIIFMEKFRMMKYLKIYLSTSEYTDELQVL